jgi:hypothetical protein
MPSVLRDRIAGLAPNVEDGDEVVLYEHWLEDLDQGIADERAKFVTTLNAIATKFASPPVAILDWAGNFPSGDILRKAYSDVIRDAILDKGAPDEEDFELARIASEGVLSNLPSEEATETLMGAMCRVASDSGLSDAVLFQLGEKKCEHKVRECECQLGRKEGIAQETIAALRHVGLLFEPRIVEGDMFEYLNERPHEPKVVDILCSYGWFIEKRNEVVHFSGVEPSEKQQLKDAWKGRIENLVEDEAVISAKPDGKKPMLEARLSNNTSIEIGWQRNEHTDVSGLVVKSYRSIDGSGDCYLLRCIRMG